MPAPKDHSRRPWTIQEDTALINAYQDGRTLSEISKLIGRPVGAINSRAKTLREDGELLALRKPRWSDAENERLAARYRNGASHNELAREFGKAKGTINTQLAALRDAGVDLTRTAIPTRKRGPARKQKRAGPQPQAPWMSQAGFDGGLDQTLRETRAGSVPT